MNFSLKKTQYNNFKQEVIRVHDEVKESLDRWCGSGWSAGRHWCNCSSVHPLPGLKSSPTMQDQSKDQKADKAAKEKHACKGQNSCKGKGGCKSGDNGCKGKNSCKGKGGCATDGSKMPSEK